MSQKLKGISVRLNLMPIHWYLKTKQGRRAAKHVVEGTLTDLETGKKIATFTGAHKLLEAIYNLQRKKQREYKEGKISE